jgi:hypothetical protein
VQGDPGDAFAYAGLALGYTIHDHGQQTLEEKFILASSAANKPLKIDPTLDEAHTALVSYNCIVSGIGQRLKNPLNKL